MSNGGLLQKAIEQQSHDEAVTVVVADVAEPGRTGMMSGPMKQGAGLGAVAFVLSWIVSSPGIQSDYSFAGIFPILMFAGSFYLVWNAMGRKQTAAIAVVYVLLAASPYAAMSLSSGEITITESELSEDATEITLTIRESGALFGSSMDSVDVSITFDEDSVFDSTLPFSIDREDGIGKYGEITMSIAEWYQGNAADNAAYVVTVDAGSSSDSMQLQSNHLQRTVDDVKSATAGAIGRMESASMGRLPCQSLSGIKATQRITQPMLSQWMSAAPLIPCNFNQITYKEPLTMSRAPLLEP